MKPLRWLAVIVLLAFIAINPLIIGGLTFIVYLLGRALTRHTPKQRYSAVGIMAISGALAAQVIAAVFPATWLVLPFTLALTFIAARGIIYEYAPVVYKPKEQDDIIEAEVISVTTIDKESTWTNKQ